MCLSAPTLKRLALALATRLPMQLYNNSKLLAVADEEGFVSIVDTSSELPAEMADDWGPNKPKAQWLAHRNAVFDIAWCNVSRSAALLQRAGQPCAGKLPADPMPLSEHGGLRQLLASADVPALVLRTAAPLQLCPHSHPDPLCPAHTRALPPAG
jgi:hypothetical protein